MTAALPDSTCRAQWLRSYAPQELFDAQGTPIAAIRQLAPHGRRRLGATVVGSTLVELFDIAVRLKPNGTSLSAILLKEAFSLPEGERQSEGFLKGCTGFSPSPQPSP